MPRTNFKGLPTNSNRPQLLHQLLPLSLLFVMLQQESQWLQFSMPNMPPSLLHQQCLLK